MKIVIHALLATCIITLFTQWSWAQPPANDDCANAVDITLLDGTCQVFQFDTCTYDLANGSCVPGANPNIWFSFTAQGPQANILVKPLGNKVTATLAYFPNGCANTTGAQEFGCGADFNVSSLTPGTTYFVIVNVLILPLDSIEICINNPVPPPNDDPCTAQVIPQNGCVNGTTVGADPDYQNPGCPTQSENAVFYSYTLGPNTDQLDISIDNNGITGNMGIDRKSVV